MTGTVTDELTLRAVSAPAFSWIRGMLLVWPGGSGRVMDVDGQEVVLSEYAGGGDAPLHEVVIDFKDWATLGCLLRLVRGAWVDMTVHTTLASRGEEWLCSGDLAGAHHGTTEGEALVAALEAAWKEL